MNWHHLKKMQYYTRWWWSEVFVNEIQVLLWNAKKNTLHPARWYLTQLGCRGSSTQWTAGELRGRCPANTGLYGYTTTVIASSCSAGFWSTPECAEGVRFKWEALPCLSHNTEITRGQKIPRGKTQNRAELGSRAFLLSTGGGDRHRCSFPQGHRSAK